MISSDIFMHNIHHDEKKRSIVPAECHNGSPVGFLQTTENHKILATIHPALYTHAVIVAQLYSIMQWIIFNSKATFNNLSFLKISLHEDAGV